MSVDYCLLVKSLYEALGHALNPLDCSEVIPPENEGILLPHGDHVITVKLDTRPATVYVSIADDGNPVCGGEVSTAGVSLLDDGFVLYAKIKTDHAVVRWIIKNHV